MTHPHRTSLEHARRDLRTFAGVERDFVATDAFRLAHAFDMRGGRYLVRAHVAQPVPDDILRLAAGIVRSLHQSLDELATELAGAPVRFPVYESLAMFAQRSRKALARMSDEAQATIEGLQPYHESGGHEDAPLWRIMALDTADAPWLTGSIRDGGVMGVNTERSVSLLGDPVVTAGAFADGAIVASVPTRIVGPDPKLDMFLRVDYVLAYTERGPGRGRDVVDLLSDLCDHVEHEVFSALEPSLSS
ncbi:MAG: hypothetical protein ABJA80_02685 [bacterium]